MENTIVAIATPPGKAGVGIVRVSGEKSIDILRLFTRENEMIFTPRAMFLKMIFLKNISDIALVVYFPAPNSFTGEDVVEIQAHGGYFLLQKIVEQAVEYGAVTAMPGEFSRRAFLNGKMTFDQAEGMIDIINAESTAQARAGSELLKGELAKKIDILQNHLTNMLAEIETKLDYPEYEFSEQEDSDILNNLDNVTCELGNLLSTHKQGFLIKNGVRVAIVGEPNVGKSSLLNAMIDSEKAIVTAIPGTTRDIVEAEYEYKGILFRLFDTAGLRESIDVVEKIGIDRAKEKIKDCDIVLAVSEFDKDINFDLFTDAPVLYIKNKIDLSSQKEYKNAIGISAKDKTNIDILKQKIFDLVMTGGYDGNAFYLTNLRHIDCVQNALECLQNAKQNFKNTTLDFVVFDVKLAWDYLGQISGKSSSEDIIDRIFSKFCLGK